MTSAVGEHLLQRRLLIVGQHLEHVGADMSGGDRHVGLHGWNPGARLLDGRVVGNLGLQISNGSRDLGFHEKACGIGPSER